jgi:O-antigen/teichoic acid export membrane protein
MSQVYCLVFWLGVLAGLGAILLGKDLILISFGADYEASYAPLVVTIWSGIFIAQSIARSVWLVGENILYLRLAVSSISLPVNIGLNIFLIPKYGAEGAAFATLISTFFGVWIFPYLFRKLRTSNIQMMRSINPIPFIFSKGM